VLGSFVHGDQDVGSITLQLSKGDVIFYRSGPNTANQHIDIMATPAIHRTLPVSTDWVALNFSVPTLPEHFQLKLEDAGSGWGEWSAIALRER
jgi:hypothetical protein